MHNIFTSPPNKVPHNQRGHRAAKEDTGGNDKKVQKKSIEEGGEGRRRKKRGNKAVKIMMERLTAIDAWFGVGWKGRRDQQARR